MTNPNTFLEDDFGSVTENDVYRTGFAQTGGGGTPVTQTTTTVTQTTTTTQLTVNATTGGAVSPSGNFSGPPGRTVSITAVPSLGYKFSRWDVTTKKVELPPAPEYRSYALVASQPVGSTSEVCMAEYQAVARELFTDGRALYTDLAGTVAPTGYWGRNGGYILWNGTWPPRSGTCSNTTNTTTQTTTGPTFYNPIDETTSGGSGAEGPTATTATGTDTVSPAGRNQFFE